eukprot:Selendium_serpulae@DN8484_c0_g1_i1.p1
MLPAKRNNSVISRKVHFPAVAPGMLMAALGRYGHSTRKVALLCQQARIETKRPPFCNEGRLLYNAPKDLLTHVSKRLLFLHDWRHASLRGWPTPDLGNTIKTLFYDTTGSCWMADSRCSSLDLSGSYFVGAKEEIKTVLAVNTSLKTLI